MCATTVRRLSLRFWLLTKHSWPSKMLRVLAQALLLPHLADLLEEAMLVLGGAPRQHRKHEHP